MQGSIVAQVRNAAQKQNRLSTFVGAILGGFVPLATFTLAHYEAEISTLRGRVALGLVIAGLVYSAITVYSWANVAFRSRPKAVGFVVLLEGAMTTAQATWLSAVALGILIMVNALATACNLAEDHKTARKAERATRAPFSIASAPARTRKAPKSKRLQVAK